MGWFSNRNTNGNNMRLSEELSGRTGAVRRARAAVRQEGSAATRRGLRLAEAREADWRRKHPGWR